MDLDFGCRFWTGRHTFLLNMLLMICFCYAMADLDRTFNGPSWLRHYGYLDPRGSTDSYNEDLPAAIREMQRFYNLEVTGVFDQQTITAMKTPRCGIPDKTWSCQVGQAIKWDKHDLTYSIETFAPKIAWQDTAKAIHKACKVWKDVSQFTFEFIPYNDIHNGLRDEADILISFHAGPQKGHEFISSELAHASSPRPWRTNYVLFNADRQWSVTNQQVQGFYSVFLVAVHQLGHILGLGHSDNTSSIMHRDYKWRDTDDFQLPAEDRQGIQDLYGYVPKPNCDALTQENARLTEENSRLTAHIANLMRQPTPPPVKSCPGGWKTFGGRCYYITTDRRMKWQEGRDYCQSQGADLVVINSPEEQAFIRGLGGEYAWIGLTRSGGRWTWLDGTPLTTTYWASGYPDNENWKDWNCAYYYHRTDPGTWGNDACSEPGATICEK